MVQQLDAVPRRAIRSQWVRALSDRIRLQEQPAFASNAGDQRSKRHFVDADLRSQDMMRGLNPNPERVNCVGPAARGGLPSASWSSSLGHRDTEYQARNDIVRVAIELETVEGAPGEVHRKGRLWIHQAVMEWEGRGEACQPTAAARHITLRASDFSELESFRISLYVVR